MNSTENKQIIWRGLIAGNVSRIPILDVYPPIHWFLSNPLGAGKCDVTIFGWNSRGCWRVAEFSHIQDEVEITDMENVTGWFTDSLIPLQLEARRIR